MGSQLVLYLIYPPGSPQAIAMVDSCSRIEQFDRKEVIIRL